MNPSTSYAPNISIQADRCRHDGLCARVCPVRIFTAAAGAVPAVAHAERCVLCGQCLAICPHEAIAHDRLDRARFARIEHHRPVEAAAALELIRQRRSVRDYRTDPVPRELLERVTAVAAYAPTSAHGQEGWTRSVTVVSGVEPMRRVRELTIEYLRELRALMGSAMVRVIARFKIEPRRGLGMVADLDLRLAEWETGRDGILYDAPAAIFVHTPQMTHEPSADCDSALYAMMLAAHAHGLGTCWNGWLTKAADAFKARRATGLRRLLEIPEHHLVGAAMTVGFPGLKLHSVPQRETRVRWVSSA